MAEAIPSILISLGVQLITKHSLYAKNTEEFSIAEVVHYYNDELPFHTLFGSFIVNM